MRTSGLRTFVCGTLIVELVVTAFAGAGGNVANAAQSSALYDADHKTSFQLTERGLIRNSPDGALKQYESLSIAHAAQKNPALSEAELVKIGEEKGKHFNDVLALSHGDSHFQVLPTPLKNALTATEDTLMANASQAPQLAIAGGLIKAAHKEYELAEVAGKAADVAFHQDVARASILEAERLLTQDGQTVGKNLGFEYDVRKENAAANAAIIHVKAGVSPIDVRNTIMPHEQTTDYGTALFRDASLKSLYDLREQFVQHKIDEKTYFDKLTQTLEKHTKATGEDLAFLVKDAKARQAAEAKQQQKKDFDDRMQTTEAVFVVGSQLLQPFNPKVASTFGNLGHAYVSAEKAIFSFNNSASSIKTLVLCSNFVGIGMSLAGSFMGGKSADQMILEAIAQLSEQINQLGKHLDERLDQIQKQLTEQHEELLNRLDQIERKLDAARDDIQTLQASINETQHLIFKLNGEAARSQISQQLGAYLGPKDKLVHETDRSRASEHLVSVLSALKPVLTTWSAQDPFLLSDPIHFGQDLASRAGESGSDFLIFRELLKRELDESKPEDQALGALLDQGARFNPFAYNVAGLEYASDFTHYASVLPKEMRGNYAADLEEIQRTAQSFEKWRAEFAQAAYGSLWSRLSARYEDALRDLKLRLNDHVIAWGKAPTGAKKVAPGIDLLQDTTSGVSEDVPDEIPACSGTVDQYAGLKFPSARGVLSHYLDLMRLRTADKIAKKTGQADNKPNTNLPFVSEFCVKINRHDYPQDFKVAWMHFQGNIWDLELFLQATVIEGGHRHTVILGGYDANVRGWYAARDKDKDSYDEFKDRFRPDGKLDVVDQYWAALRKHVNDILTTGGIDGRFPDKYGFFHNGAGTDLRDQNAGCANSKVKAFDGALLALMPEGKTPGRDCYGAETALRKYMDELKLEIAHDAGKRVATPEHDLGKAAARLREIKLLMNKALVFANFSSGSVRPAYLDNLNQSNALWLDDAQLSERMQKIESAFEYNGIIDELAIRVRDTADVIAASRVYETRGMQPLAEAAGQALQVAAKKSHWWQK